MKQKIKRFPIESVFMIVFLFIKVFYVRNFRPEDMNLEFGLDYYIVFLIVGMLLFLKKEKHLPKVVLFQTIIAFYYGLTNINGVYVLSDSEFIETIVKMIIPCLFLIYSLRNKYKFDIPNFLEYDFLAPVVYLVGMVMSKGGSFTSIFGETFNPEIFTNTLSFMVTVLLETLMIYFVTKHFHPKEEPKKKRKKN